MYHYHKQKLILLNYLFKDHLLLYFVLKLFSMAHHLVISKFLFYLIRPKQKHFLLDELIIFLQLFYAKLIH